MFFAIISFMIKIIAIIISIFLFFGCSRKNPTILTYMQSTSSLVKDIKPMEVKIQNYKHRLFMPWGIKHMSISKNIASWANNVYSSYGKYYAENTLLWDKDEVKKIINNTNFNAYNTKNLYAITTKNTQVRNLPTNKPFFRKTTLAGEGFPFDYMQNSRLHVNTPLFISHYSKDGAWAFVQNTLSSGWLPTDSFVLLDAKQRVQFINNKKITIINDNIPIYSNTQRYIIHIKLGAIFPYVGEDDDFYNSYMYINTFTSFGKKLYVRIPKKYSHTLPLDFNKKNILHVSSQLLGEKYGWGGYLLNRDCSSMTKDYLSTFGLWVPRNSAGQKNSGDYLSFKGMNNEEKEKMIIKSGIAFLSLIYLHGHIMLYAGELENKAMVMHNMWGVKTDVNGKEGRAIVGKAVISDLYLGQNIKNVKKDTLLIDRVEGIVIKPGIKTFVVNKFVKAYLGIFKIKNNIIYFDDNTTMIYDNHIKKTFEEKLKNPSVKDMISIKYHAFADIKAPNINDDSGRFRNDELLKKLYGKDKKSIEKNLINLKWVDGSIILFNKKQNAAKKLEKVIIELKKLPTRYMKYIQNIAGTYVYRYIAGTSRLSTHSYGIGIDINIKESNYWKWDKDKIFKNKIPKEIIDIFERYGFIWGGRWYHYDTMHFEYRPELFDSID